VIYDFDKPIDRSKNFSVKYDEAARKFGTSNLLPMWIADMDLPTAQPIIDAMIQRARQGIFGYTSRPDSYFEAIRDWQKRRNDWNVAPSLFSFCPGVVSALCTIVREFSEPGDEVLVHTPVYPEFFSAVTDWGRRLIESPLILRDGQYTVDFEDFEARLKRHPAIFILCNPHNPGGHVWTPEELRRMGELCLRYDVKVVSDEIHSDLMLWGNHHRPLAKTGSGIAANTITCVSATKTFNLAGLQACTVIHPDARSKERFDDLWRRLDLKRNNCFSLVAMEAAYRYGEEWLDQVLRHIEGNMMFVNDFLQANLPEIVMPIPESTYLAWINFEGLGLTPDQLWRFMIDKARLGLNDGRDFGKQGAGFLRLNVACPRPLLGEAMDRLKAAVDAYRGR
jgi:cystathionine beta-lyase